MSSRNKSLNLTLKMNGVEVENTLDAVKGRMYRLRASVNRLEEGTKNWVDQTKKLGAVTNEYKRMISAQKELGGNIEKSNKSILSQVGSFVGMAAGFSGIFSIVTGGIRKFSQFASGAVDLAREAKGVEYAFERMGETGEKAFHKIKEATRGTLSDLDIKKAMVEFDTFNISQEHTADLFEFLTVRATQTGKSIEYLQSSLVEGLSKESKLRIDNLGISAAELNAQLEKTPDFVEAVAIIAKREIGKAGAILDEAANANNKWNAQLQNTQLWLGNLMENSGGGSFFKDMGTNILALVTPAGDLSDAFKQQAHTVIDLQKNINPLINEYEDLKGKSELSKDEQDRLKDVIYQLADAIPSAVTAFDEYGNALDISADKARDFVQAQQAVLAVKNQDVIKQQTEALKTYEAQLRTLDMQIKNRDKDGDIIKDVTTGYGADKMVYEQKLSDEEIRILQAKINKIKQMEMGAKLYIEELSGDYLEKIVKKEEEQTARTLDEVRKRADMLGLEYGPEATASEIEAMIKKWEALAGERDKLNKAAQKKAAAAAAKYVQEEQNLDKFLAELRLNRVINQKAGLDKELAQIDAKYEKELEKYAAHADRLKDIEEARDLEKADAKVRIQEEYLERINEIEDEDRILREEAELEREIEAAETAEDKELLRIEFARKLALDELEALKQRELEKVEAVENAEKLKAAIIANYTLQTAKLNREFDKQALQSAKDKVKWTEMTEDQKLSLVVSSLSSAAQAFNEGSAAWKAIKISETAIATYQAGVLAYSSALEGFPAPANLVLAPVMAGFAVASGLAQVNKIANTRIAKVPTPRKGFARGGYTDSYGLGYKDETGHEVAGDVHVNEYVVPEIVRRDPEVPQILDYLERKRKQKLGISSESEDASSSSSGSSSSSVDVSRNNALLERLLLKLDEPIISHTLYDVEAAMARQEVDKKLSKIQKETKIKKD